MNILVIDIGTTSTKGMIYDETLALLSQRCVQTRPEFPDEIRAQQTAGDWDRALVEIFKDAAKKGIPYDAVTLTAQRSSVIPVNRDGEALYPAIMWQDRRTAAGCLEKQEAGDWVYERTGLTIRPIYAAPKMEWIRRRLPDVYRDTWKFMLISDYCIFRMTGNAVMDYTYGNRTLLMDLHTCKWDRGLLSLFGVEEEKLCRLVRQGSLCGTITKEFSAASGARQGVPVYTAGGDQQCAALGLGILRQGDTEITHGTGSFLLSMQDSSRLDKEKVLSCNVAAIPGSYLLEASFLTTGAAFDWVRDNLYREEKGYGRIGREIQESGPGAGGVVALPHFQGTGTPDWNPYAKGLFYNISMKNNRGDLARAVLEGIAMEIEKSVRYLERFLGDQGRRQELSVSGGLCQMPLFNQMQADIYLRGVRSYDNPQASSVGAWMSCATELGITASYKEAFERVVQRNGPRIYRPRREQAKFYEELKSRYGFLYDALKGSGVYAAFAGGRERRDGPADRPDGGEKNQEAREWR